MKTEYKIAGGISIFLLFLLWALRTKNEVVHSMTMPLRVWLGLDEYKTDGLTADNASAKITSDGKIQIKATPKDFIIMEPSLN